MIGVCGNVVAQTVSNATKILTATIVPEVANVPLPSRSVGDRCESVHSLCCLALSVFGVLLCFSWLLLLKVVFWFCFPLTQAVFWKNLFFPLSLSPLSPPSLPVSLHPLPVCVCVLFFSVFHHSPSLSPSTPSTSSHLPYCSAPSFPLFKFVHRPSAPLLFISFIWILVECLISRWALSISQWQL